MWKKKKLHEKADEKGRKPGNVANSSHDLGPSQLSAHVTVQQASANLQLRSLNTTSKNNQINVLFLI
jgi:hypothetical protein